jgi:putative addiction module component (TIGR02574 family)
MTAAAQKLKKQVLALPNKDRAQLAGLLIKSLDVPGEKVNSKEWDQAWGVELKKRLNDVRTGKVKTVPAHEVMAELKAKYG